MIAAEPTVQAVMPDGVILPWWSDRERMRALLMRVRAEGLRALSLARWAPERDWRDISSRCSCRRRRICNAAGSRDCSSCCASAGSFAALQGRQIADLIAFATGSLGEFLDRSLDSPHLKSLVLSNSLYGKHGGPYDPGHVVWPAVPSAGRRSGGEAGLRRARDGRHGRHHRRRWPRPAWRRASRSARSSPVQQVVDRDRVARRRGAGGRLADRRGRRGLECRSQAHVPGARRSQGTRRQFRADVRGIKMDGPCGKLNLVLDEEPKLRAAIPTPTRCATRSSRSCRGSKARSAATRARGRARVHERLWIDCLVPSLSTRRSSRRAGTS